MKLNNAQCTLVTENLRLVHKVIHDKVHSPQQLGMFSYDDLFQIGCIGLCKAAATDKGGVSSTNFCMMISIPSAFAYAGFLWSMSIKWSACILLLASMLSPHRKQFLYC